MQRDVSHHLAVDLGHPRRQRIGGDQERGNVGGEIDRVAVVALDEVTERHAGANITARAGPHLHAASLAHAKRIEVRTATRPGAR